MHNTTDATAPLAAEDEYLYIAGRLLELGELKPWAFRPDGDTADLHGPRGLVVEGLPANIEPAALAHVLAEMANDAWAIARAEGLPLVDPQPEIAATVAFSPAGDLEVAFSGLNVHGFADGIPCKDDEDSALFSGIVALVAEYMVRVGDTSGYSVDAIAENLGLEA